VEIFAVGDVSAVAGPVHREGPSDLEALTPRRSGRIRIEPGPGAGTAVLTWHGEGEDPGPARTDALRVAARVAQKVFPAADVTLVSPTPFEDAGQLTADGFREVAPGRLTRPAGPFPLRRDKADDADGVYADPLSTPWNFVPAETAAYTALASQTPRRVLDLGCGHGKNTRLLHRYGHEVTGVDVSPLAIERCHRYLPELEFRVASADDLPFPDAHFDAVVDIGCLHYLDDATRARAVAELARVLRPGGTLHSRIFRPRPAAWLAAQPFTTERFGLTDAQVHALFADRFSVEAHREDPDMHYLRCTLHTIDATTGKAVPA
jgi:SAM-dependent methyltransferase